MQGRKPRIAIVGSCVTRDAFLDADPVRVVHYTARTSVLSIYARPVAIGDDVLARVEPEFIRRCIRTDFRKTLMAEMAASAPDAVVVDFIDERFDVFRADDRVVSKSWDMYQAGLWQVAVDQGLRDASKEDPALRAQLLDCARRFFRDLAGMVGADRVFLHRAECADRYLDLQGQEQTFDDETRATNARTNALIGDLVGAARGILPPRAVIDVMDGMRADAANIWQLAPFHYEPRYYRAFMAALVDRLGAAARD